MTDAGSITVLSVLEDDARRSLAIELSDGTSIEVAQDAEEARGITPGLELSEDQTAGLQAADERRRIARHVFQWLDRRPRTRQDLDGRLRERGYSRAGIEAVLDQFEREGLVDDRAFAEQFARERLRNRPVGPRWLFGRLRRDGVAGQVVQAVVDDLFSEFDEIDLAIRALEQRSMRCLDESGRQRAARFLNSRGFGTPAAVEAIRQLRNQGN